MCYIMTYVVGVVAQLGERLLDVQEVCGSSPHGPMKNPKAIDILPVAFSVLLFSGFLFCSGCLCVLFGAA